MAVFLTFFLLTVFTLPGVYVDENNIKYFNETFYENYQSRLTFFRTENENAFPGGIVFIGNSITQGFAVDKFFPGVLVYNRGIVGDQIGIQDCAGVTKRLKESCFDLDPLAIFIMIGINDIGSRPAAGIAAGYSALLDAIFDSLPMVELYVQSVLPATGDYARLNLSVDSLNLLLQNIVDEKSHSYFIRYVNLNSEFKDSAGRLKAEFSFDGLHLSQSGFAKWAEFISPLIYKNDFFFSVTDSYMNEDFYQDLQNYNQ